jgi:hypothetical protein
MNIILKQCETLLLLQLSAAPIQLPCPRERRLGREGGLFVGPRCRSGSEAPTRQAGTQAVEQAFQAVRRRLTPEYVAG